jgi:hypothetical protein
MFFKKNRDADVGDETVTPNSLLPRRMNLEERKAFRRDLVDQVIRESLQALNVVSGMYRLRTMPLDVRHHRFIAMIDVGQDFRARSANRDWNFRDVENFIKKNAFERFGLVLDGIYWRVSAAMPASRPHANVADLAPNPFQLVSDEEKEALMEAIRQGSERPVLHVGDREYQTEMAPLDEGGHSRHDDPAR